MQHGISLYISIYSQQFSRLIPLLADFLDMHFLYYPSTFSKQEYTRDRNTPMSPQVVLNVNPKTHINARPNEHPL